MENSNSTNSFLQFNDNQSNNNSTNQQQFQYSTSPTFNTLSPTSSTSSSSLLESTSLSLPFSPQYYYHQQQQHRDQLPSLLPPALTYSNQPQTRSEPSEREAVEFTSHRITATTDWRRSNFNYNSGIYISPTTVHLPPISPPPVPRTTLPLHRVYILNCSTCDTFLSDRGMRAVLLLKPHIILYSTDTSPSNSGPVQYNTEVEEVEEEGEDGNVLEKSCECLTRTIGCFGCGTVVGYNIIQPCIRCTSSIKKRASTNSSNSVSGEANHHRFVFHSTEVKIRERKFFLSDDTEGEEEDDSNLDIKSFNNNNPRLVMSRSSSYASSSSSTSNSPTTPTVISNSAPSLQAFDNQWKPLEFPLPHVSNNNQHLLPSPPSFLNNVQFNPSPNYRYPIPPSPKSPQDSSLKEGDTIYWHHLVQGEELKSLKRKETSVGFESRRVKLGKGRKERVGR